MRLTFKLASVPASQLVFHASAKGLPMHTIPASEKVPPMLACMAGIRTEGLRNQKY
jgi:hypothetical protein